VTLYFGNPQDPYSLNGFFGTTIDTKLLGVTHLYKGEGVPFDPEGLASLPGAIVQVIFGYLIGQYIQTKGKTFDMLTNLFVAGCILVLAGYCWDYVFPITKKTWTSSYTVYTTGLATLTLSILIYWIEFKEVRAGWSRFFDVFGKNPLFIFVLSGFLPRVLGLLRWVDHLDEAGKKVYTTPFNWFYLHICKNVATDLRIGSLVYALCMIAFYWTIVYFLDKKKIYINFESVNDIGFSNTLYFSSALTNYNYFLPIYTCYYGFSIYNFLKEDRKIISEDEFNNKKNVMSIISNTNGTFRNSFLLKLMNKINVDNYGKYKRNILNKIISESTWFDPRISDIIKNYKFILCMENIGKVGYHTEKIMHGFRNNVIPIYWGDSNCTKIFNSKAYINVNELGIEKSIDKIIELSQDIKKYNNMLSEKILKEDSILFNEDLKKYLSEENFGTTINNFINK
jgi:hypothetical protein